MTVDEALDRLFEIRLANNVPWKELMKIALRRDPASAIALVQEIRENDLRVSHLMSALAKAVADETV